MFIAPADRARRRGFTLLEITLAVAILAMMSVAIYRFVLSNLTAVRISSEENAIDARYDGLRALLTAQWQSLPGGDGALTGEPFKFENRPRDEISWICGAGPGLLTRYAPGEFKVTMRLRPAGKNKERMEIGVTRKPEANEAGDETWIPLIDDVKSLQIRYFDPRFNSWIDRWADTVTLPRLVKLVIGRPNSAVPWETVIALSRTPL
jgi:prepilin-type N-terminal cleavage/methylation domain-containing protein